MNMYRTVVEALERGILLRKSPGKFSVQVWAGDVCFAIGHNGELSTMHLSYKSATLTIKSLWILGVFLQYSKGLPGCPIVRQSQPRTT